MPSRKRKLGKRFKKIESFTDCACPSNHSLKNPPVLLNPLCVKGTTRLAALRTYYLNIVGSTGGGFELSKPIHIKGLSGCIHTQIALAKKKT